MAGIRDRFLARIGAGEGVRATARAMGLNESTALNWAQRAKREMARHALPDAERPAVAQVTDAAEARIEELLKRQRQLEHDLRYSRERQRKAEGDELTAERVREAIFGLAAETPAPPEWLIEAPSGGSAPGVPVAFWSDWHWSEKVRRQEVGGVNEYSCEIARARVRRLVESTISLCFDHMVRPEYPGIVIPLGGDMTSGDIHEELAQTNEISTLQTVIELADVLTWALRTMVSHFHRVFVPCVVGNHGRNTKRPRMKGRTFTNFDWLLYCLLERAFKDDPRVRFQIPEGADAMFQIYDRRFLLTHGDALGVKGGDGIIGALGPIMRGKIKLANSEAQIGRDFDTLMMGHWHQYITLPGLVVNGSLKGYDEFARLALRAPYQRPTQALFFVHRKHGLTCHWPVFLESTPAKDDAAWLSWRD